MTTKPPDRIEIIKVNSGQKLGNQIVMSPVELRYIGNRIYFYFAYNKYIMEEIKCLQGRKYHGYDDINPQKVWSAPNNKRNRFSLEYLQLKNPYQHYQKDLIAVDNFFRPVKLHQKEMTSFILNRKRCIIAGEMGTGKTLAAIEALERMNLPQLIPWYVAPKAALNATILEFEKWKSKAPTLYTYDNIVKLVTTNANKNEDEEFDLQGNKLVIPNVLFLDESSKVKTYGTLRFNCVQALVEEMFRRYDDPYIILMSGSPAPKSPVDWWAQCELACPGFLKEGHPKSFQARLAVIKQMDKGDGVTFPKILAWKDRENMCGQCGELKDSIKHTTMQCVFTPCENEVAKLYRRMKGLVLVKLKKDCLDLPDKIFKPIQLEISEKHAKYASLLKKKNTRAVTAMMQLRELSDGFLYIDEEVKDASGQILYNTCDVCKGSGKITVPEEDFCPSCLGEGKTPSIARKTEYITSPKEDAYKDILEAHTDGGRLVSYGGFTGTVDLMVKISTGMGFNTIRVDGRGWHLFGSDGKEVVSDSLSCLRYFQSDSKDLISFCGQADSAGMGLTLTASPTICYYSNSFRGESRIQSMDRIHRLGMNISKGATIIDLLHLKVDQYILDVLNNNRRLQDITLGELPDE